MPLGLRHVGVDHRELDVRERRGARDEVEALEHEPDLAVAHDRQRVPVERRDVDAVEQVAAGRADVETADDVHQRALAASRRAHDRDVLAGGDVEADAAERVHRGVALAVDLREVAERDDRRVSTITDLRRRAAATQTAAAGRSAAAAREAVFVPVDAAVVITTWSPALKPVVISTALSPRSPIVIVRVLVVPSALTMTVWLVPVVDTAEVGSVITSSRLSSTTLTDAVMPGFTPSALPSNATFA